MIELNQEHCPVCGTAYRYIFRTSAKHWKSGTTIRPKRGKALKIRVRDCNC